MSFDLDVRKEQGDFLDLMFEESGNVCLATRWGPSKKEFKRTFFQWPRQREAMLNYIAACGDHEVYFSPDMFIHEATTYKRENILGSQWVAADLDGNAPSTDVWDEDGLYHNTPRPTVVIQSSTEANKHFYWKVPWTTDIDFIEDARRYVIHNLEADTSGWDAGQLLRIPFTVNMGYRKNRDKTYEVVIDEMDSDRVYLWSDFPAPTNFSKYVEQEISTELPSLNAVLAKHSFVDEFTGLFNKAKIPADHPDGRSGALARLAYILAESSDNTITNEEMFTVLYDADMRWEKYAGRTDQKKQLSRLIARARNKHPYGSSAIPFGDTIVELGSDPVKSYKEFRKHKVKTEWMFTNLLTMTGYGMLVGPPNIGKTQIAIQFCKAAALGKPVFKGLPDTLWANETKGINVLFLSLEMGYEGINYFLDIMEPVHHNNGEVEILDTKLKLMADMDNWYLDGDRKNQRAKDLVGILKGHKIQLLVIDSLWKTSRGDTSKEETIKNLSDILMRIRKECNCAIVMVHHVKKKQNTKYYTGDLDDVLGSIFITAEADFVLMFLPASQPKIKEFDQEDDEYEDELTKLICVPAKIRLGKKPNAFRLERTANLEFEKVQSGGDFIQRDTGAGNGPQPFGAAFPEV